MVDPRVTGVKRVDYLPAAMSDLDKAVFSAPWTQVDSLSIILRCNRSPSEIRVPYVGETCWSLGSVSYDPFAGFIH